ncbi:MAG: hypothetical protein RMI91_10985 [Gemmatales bacterium]|nr:hypothetical protein [Gemmatales bacterium]MDW7995167.1 hypothetical protein [Gemmatales bacterium]
MRRFSLLSLMTHGIAFLLGALFVAKSTADETLEELRGFDPLRRDTGVTEFPVEWSKLRPLLERRWTCGIDPDRYQLSESAARYKWCRVSYDGFTISILNTAEGLFQHEDQKRFFEKFHKENKIWHPEIINELLGRIPARMALDFAGPPAYGLSYWELPIIITAMILSRDAPGFGNAGDVIWLTTAIRDRPVEFSNLYFINARTGKIFALFPYGPKDNAIRQGKGPDKVLFPLEEPEKK